MQQQRRECSGQRKMGQPKHPLTSQPSLRQRHRQVLLRRPLGPKPSILNPKPLTRASPAFISAIARSSCAGAGPAPLAAAAAAGCAAAGCSTVPTSTPNCGQGQARLHVGGTAAGAACAALCAAVEKEEKKNSCLIPPHWLTPSRSAVNPPVQHLKHAEVLGLAPGCPPPHTPAPHLAHALQQHGDLLVQRPQLAEVLGLARKGLGCGLDGRGRHGRRICAQRRQAGGDMVGWVGEGVGGWVEVGVC